MLIDFHTHTNCSDGHLSAAQLVSLARSRLNALAITDHNSTFDLRELRSRYCNSMDTDIELIQGSEISCLHNGHEIHVVALGFDPTNEKMMQVFKENTCDRRPYAEAILEKLRTCSIYLSYEDVVRANDGCSYVARPQIAHAMVAHGYCKSTTEAMDIYIGNFGLRKAFADNPTKKNYVTMEHAVDAIRSAGGVPVLAHLFYYQLGHDENIRLIRTFKELAGDCAAMETEYGIYTRLQRDHLKELCQQFGLLASAGSDFHGVDPKETLLDQDFDHARIDPLLERLGLK